VRYLLDENVSELIAPAMQALADAGEHFAHVIDVAGRASLTDDEVVELCHEKHFDVLITINVKDFGAKAHYYTALEQRGIHVIVARPMKAQPDVGQQMGLICSQFGAVRKLLSDSEGPALVKVTRSTVVRRTLIDLLAEQHAPKYP
jgi:hypothetical protein